MKVVNLFFFLILLSVFLCCNNNSWIKYYKNEYIPRGIEGEIINTELWKGSVLSLELKNNSKEEKISIHTDYEILVQIQKGDYFKKTANTNKCFIKRGDSIIYIDCYKLSNQEQKYIKNLKEWQTKKKNKWQLDK